MDGPSLVTHEDRVGNWPIELCYHIENCLGHRMSEAADTDYIDFHDLMKERAKAKAHREHEAVSLEERVCDIFRRSYGEGNTGLTKCLFCPREGPALGMVDERVVHAIKNGDLESLRAFLDHPTKDRNKGYLEGGCSANSLSWSGFPLITLAVLHSQQACIDILLDYGADVNKRSWWNDGLPLDYIIPYWAGNTHFTGADILWVMLTSEARFTYMNAFNSLCAIPERMHALRAAVAHGTNLRALRGNDGMTVLQAVYKDFVYFEDIVEYVEEAVPDLMYLKDLRGRSVMWYVACSGNGEKAREILTMHRAIQVEGWEKEMFVASIATGNVYAAKYCLENENFPIKEFHENCEFKDSPLGMALLGGHGGIMRLLLNHPEFIVPEASKRDALEYASTDVWAYQYINRLRRLRTEDA
ncbi:hypothetical protein BO70DRAFT_350623 [Aspergillus heteromorphus CBS 117.55]|uniref:Ankyrin n=1 Tax=Aspergillus heteromorphus CBS 117.55 TaxID=1448321 RepID=A0A317WP17_9EURO|nr:uncharacterized protein BO70DRAFT_350623 [Aspergillus heteromorphus CBS 117.55]PWY88234.1 hypothetical protein BO70DRAFT_350623 [Aspergillus heteromorphus CBS 117.55]